MSNVRKARLLTRRIPPFMMGVGASAAGTGNVDLMDSQNYQAILKRNVIPSVGILNLGDPWTLQQDSDPKHTSKSTKAW